MNDYDVHLGDQIVVSCAAQGSYGINFTWYKDDMLVNTSKATRYLIQFLSNLWLTK